MGASAGAAVGCVGVRGAHPQRRGGRAVRGVRGLRAARQRDRCAALPDFCARTPPHPTSCSVHRGHGRRGTAHPLRWPAAAPAPRRRSLRRGRQRPALGPYPARPRANGAAARAAGSAHDREWEAHDALEWYGFDIAPCLASGCTEEMLNNERCDEQCNHDLCDYGPPPAIANRRSLPGGSRPPSLLAAGRSILTAAGVGCGQTWGCASSSTICTGTAGTLRVRRRPSPRLLYPLSQASPSDSACLPAKPEQGLARGMQAVRRRAAEGSCCSTASATRNARARSATGTTGDASGRMSSSSTTRSATVRAKPVESCATASFERSRMHL